ncbi:MAG: type II toxin-antitoxin system Phd/YefM family antitoxin [Candidatus Limnocylindria bacterium]
MTRAKIGVRELRQNLSVHLKRVVAGETLEVTERGRPVALLSPLPERMTPLERLIAEGRATRPVGRLKDLPPALRLEGGPTLSEILGEMREERL